MVGSFPATWGMWRGGLKVGHCLSSLRPKWQQIVKILPAREKVLKVIWEEEISSF